MGLMHGDLDSPERKPSEFTTGIEERNDQQNAILDGLLGDGHSEEGSEQETDLQFGSELIEGSGHNLHK